MRTKIRQQLLSLAFFLLATVAGAQTLKGKVTDDQKEPLLGVTILVKDNPSRGATTNEKGEFTLRVSPEETLVFSYIGFKTKEVKVGKHKQLLVSLESEAEELPELLVVGSRAGGLT